MKNPKKNLIIIIIKLQQMLNKENFATTSIGLDLLICKGKIESPKKNSHLKKKGNSCYKGISFISQTFFFFLSFYF